MLLRPPLFLSIAFLSVAACAGTAEPEERMLTSGVFLVETVSPTVGEIGIPYEKYVLENGLTVILHKDYSDPLVHVDVTYHVGSAREEIGKSGFAHFFEHMMFQGSENVADEEHFRLVTEAGGVMNGTTSSDRTNYFQTVPKNHLERVLWLEADRMGFLLPAVTQEKFEVQRATVKNERAQQYDNRPYGLLNERVNEALYPEGHPYSWQPIGYVEDLDLVDLDDLKAFFLRWYGPNNATLTIGGDFEKTQVLEWIVKYFGSIPRGSAVNKPSKPYVSLDADRYISMEDNVSLPLLQKAWPTVYAAHADEAPLDVLMSIMGSGHTSLLYESMVKAGFAVQAGTSHYCSELSCSFAVTALPDAARGVTLADLERILAESFAAFEKRGVSDDDLARVKAGVVSNMIYNLESVAGKVSRLAYYETFFDNPDRMALDIARYEAVTKADVMRVYATYIKNKPTVVMSVVPRGQPDAVAAPDNWAKSPRSRPTHKEPADFAARAPLDAFDRSVMPPIGPLPEIIAPAIWRDALANGIEVLGSVNDETPTTLIQLRIKAGRADQSLDKLGVAALTAAMMNEATMRSTAEDLSNRLQKLGGQVVFSTGQDASTLTIRALTDNLDETLKIASERLLYPKFGEADFERLRAQTLQNLRQQAKNPAAVADYARRMLVYGKSNAFVYPSGGTEKTLTALTVNDIKKFYTDYYVASLAKIAVVSSLPQDAVVHKLRVFERWRSGEAVSRAGPVMAEDVSRAIYLIDMPGASQSEVRIAKRALPYDATGAYYRLGVANFPLGGNFNSRINLNLREDKGYTYGATSGFGGNAQAGGFTVRAAVLKDATGVAIAEMLKEIDAYAAKGMTTSELSFTKAALNQRHARAYETPRQKIALLSLMQAYDLEPGFLAEQSAILYDVTIEELNALVAKYLQTDEMIIVVVGDREVVLPQLRFPNLEIIDTDIDTVAPL